VFGWPNVGDVGDSFGVGSRRTEVALQVIAGPGFMGSHRSARGAKSPVWLKVRWDSNQLRMFQEF
jgi:hypothetical protein